MKRNIFFISLFLSAVLLYNYTIAENGVKVSFVLLEFSPKKLLSYVPIEIYFAIQNNGSEFVSPYAEVVVSGEVFTAKGRPVLKLDDQKYYVYNLGPGSRTGKQKLYVGSLPDGDYILRLNTNAFNRAKQMYLSNEKLELELKIDKPGN